MDRKEQLKELRKLYSKNEETKGERLFRISKEAEFLKLIRHTAGFKRQEDAARVVSVPRRTWQNWETGSSELPRAALELFCWKTKLPFDEWIWWDVYLPKVDREIPNKMMDKPEILNQIFSMLDAIGELRKAL